MLRSKYTFKRKLKLARRIEQIAVAGQVTKVMVRQRSGPSAEPDPVKDVERFRPEINPDLLLDWEALGDRHVLIQVCELPDLGMVARGIANAGVWRAGARAGNGPVL